MTNNNPQWRMLKDDLRAAIDELPGYRVTNAVFTTYAFEPAFFETSILPLLLPNGDHELSLHATVRRLQVESLLRDTPIEIDLYFDERVVVPGCPLLPYQMNPVRVPGGEFHGKVVLLQLVNEQGNVRCILGAGSANLTCAGWWNNTEAWYFAPPFDPARPPAGLAEGLNSLLQFLRQTRRAGKATESLAKIIRYNSTARLRQDEPVFGAFAPNFATFLDWLPDHTPEDDAQDTVEIISPYFAESEHAKAVSDVLEAARCKRAHVWLPEDPWQAGGAAAVIEEARYDALGEVKDLRWCRLQESTLAASRKPDAIPRFLHAKVIRKPGKFCFMGSVNFSNRAFRRNFEAGFLFPDSAGPWLAPRDDRPTRFLRPEGEQQLSLSDVAGPELTASFDWETMTLIVDLLCETDRDTLQKKVCYFVDAAGNTLAPGFELPATITAGHRLSQPVREDLRSNPWIRVQFPDKSMGLAWVHQRNLTYRPPAEDLNPGVWRILEMWRALAEGRTGSQPGDFEPLEIILRSRLDDEQAPPEGGPAEDLFAAMATVHGSLHLLRTRLGKELKDRDDQRRYYFSAPRPDTLRTLVDRLDGKVDSATEGTPVDPVAQWVILQWVLQICLEHKDIKEAGILHKRVEVAVKTLMCRPPLKELEPMFLDWARRMFLCEAGKERNVARHFKGLELKA